MRSNYCGLIDSWSSQDYALCIFLWTCIASKKSGFVFCFLLKNPTLRGVQTGFCGPSSAHTKGFIHLGLMLYSLQLENLKII